MFELVSTIFSIDDIKKLSLNGATGIIVGDEFHASRTSNIFTLKEIKQITEEAHKYNLKVYVLMNRMYVDEELERCDEYIKYLLDINIDYIIYNDLSVYVVAKKYDIANKLIYNPDTIVTNSFDVNYHLSKGIHSVILSKEITKEEMIKIGLKSDKNVGIIVHGYLNMSYSKRKLISNYFEFIEKDNIDVKNKKDIYLIEENRSGIMPIIEDEQGTSIFTDYIQESFEEFSDLFNSNIRLFIVDGIFLSSEAVIDAINCYRKLIDGEDSLKIKNWYYEKYNYLPLSTGYMDKETNLIK